MFCHKLYIGEGLKEYWNFPLKGQNERFSLHGISYEMGLLFDVTKWALCDCYNLGLFDTIPSDSMHIKQCYDMGML